MCPAVLVPNRRIMEPIPVAILTWGQERKSGAAARKAMGEFGWREADVWDLRRDLQDPRDNASRVLYETDGSHDWVQRAVFAQSAMPWLIEQCCEEVFRKSALKHGVVVFRACKTGYHRCDTVARCEKEVLNRLETSHGRVFNAQHFPLCNVQPRDVNQHMKLAQQWIEAPFAVTRGGKNAPRENLYGYDACATRPDAARNFQDIYNIVDEKLIPRLQAHFDKVLGTAEAKRQKLAEGATPETPYPPPNSPFAAEPSSPDSVVAMGPRPPPGPPPTMMGKPPPPTPPPMHQSARLSPPMRRPPPPPMRGSVQPKQQLPPPKPKEQLPPQPPWQHQQPQQQEPQQQQQPEEQQQQQSDVQLQLDMEWQLDELSQQSGLPEWATFGRNPAAWLRFLEIHGVDEVARQSVFLLAQHSEKGFQKANEVIGKILKKFADGVLITNPSGFVHRCCQNARNDL